MGAIEKDRHRPWLAYALEESLGRSLLAPRDVIEHANPEVLVAQLPTPVISELFSRALAAGTFTPAQVLESAPPALLAQHLDPDVMWGCLKEAADRGGITKKGGVRSGPARQWFAGVLARALDTELIAPADVLRFLPPPEFVDDAPRSVMADLIKDALVRGTFDAALVLQHFTPSVIADHLETALVWSCIAEAAARHFELGTSAAKGDEASAPRASVAPIATAPSAAAAAIKPIAKPLENKAADKGPDKNVIERRTTALNEKPAPAASAAVGAAMSAAARSLGNAPNSGRADLAARANAIVSATSPATAPVVTTAPAPTAAGNDTTEWSPADDLDVLEDQPLPFPLPR